MYQSTFGKKWVCFDCQTSFFDLNKETVICPKCKADQAKNPHIIVYKNKYKAIKEDIEPDDGLIDLDDGDLNLEDGIESFEEMEEKLREQELEEDELEI